MRKLAYVQLLADQITASGLESQPGRGGARAPGELLFSGATADPVQGIVGHRQVTDAYLAQLTRARGSRLATFDQALATLHNDVAELIPGN
jgi:hypothetical protein